jgi:putative membrane-bound dehydrogenase-like protein
MKQKLAFAFTFLICLATTFAQQDKVRVFIRGGVKTHGPGQHDHPRFLAEWTELLNQRGAKADGAMDFPSAEQLEKTDVLVIYAAEGGSIKPEQRAYLEKFLKRGGGMVVIHDAVCGTDPQWFKTIVGGAWEHKHSKWYEGELSFYYMDTGHPITSGVSNFELDDELYYELHMMPEARVLAATYTPNRPDTARASAQSAGKPSVYDIQPQMWVYEKTLAGGQPYRAFVSILGHNHKTFGLPNYRAVLLRGIAWAGQRANVDVFCSKEELASLRYPEGGPTSPEKAAARLEVHPDFTLSLVAAEPLINKPINIDWDPSGRLWVAETPEYPNGRREPRAEFKNTPWKDSGWRVRPPITDRPAIDRISILTDTDGDGRMDKKEIFYEGLELVTGFVFYKDGVIAVQAPDVLWIRDTNGDGKGDKVEKLYTGLGIGDTHAVINNPRWGFDGWIYCTHGYSGSEHVYNGDKSKDFGRINSGVVRFKPDGSAFEQYSSKGGNTWGLDISWDNEVFYTQPTSGDLLMHVVMPESVLARGKVGNTASFKSLIRLRPSFPLITYNQQAYVQIDVVGSFTAAAGCAIYDGGTWPAEWNYSYFTTEPTINLVHHEVVEPDGVTYKAHKTREPEFIGGRDKWFRPIETRIGPDGALYIIDFYNQAVVHNDTRGTAHGPANAAVRPDRDHYFGRIWKVDHKQATKNKVPNLAKASSKELVKALEHPNRHVRMNAMRLLVERRKDDVTRSLFPLVNSKKPPYARIAAIWTLAQLRFFSWPHDKETPDPIMVKNYLKALTATTETAEQPAGKLGKENIRPALTHRDDQVRLQAIIALGTQSLEAESIEALVAAYPHLQNAWLESAAIGVAAQTPLKFLEAAFDSKQPEALQGLIGEVSKKIAENGSLAGPTLEVIAAKPASTDSSKQLVLETLAKNLKADASPSWTTGLQAAFKKLLASSSPALPTAALPLIARWDKDATMASDVNALLPQLLAKLNDPAQPESARAQVVTSLLGLRQMNPDILPSIASILGSSASPNLQRQVIESLGGTADAAAGRILAEAYPKLPTELQQAAFGQLTKRSDWCLALLERLKGGQVTLATLGPTAVHRLRTHSDSAVRERARLVIEELRGPEEKEKNALIASLTPQMEKPGDAARGKALFAQNCAVCHKFNGEGKEVGPELTGMGAHGAVDLLVAILDPNREVDPSFLAWSFETRDGETYDGIIARENRAGVLVKNNSGEMELKSENIQGRRNTGRSLMPEGFEALGPEGLRNILAFICGSDANYRIIDLRNAFTADSTKGIYTSKESVGETLSFKKFGLVKAGDVPFEIIHPNKTSTGKNVIVLKGGNGLAKSLPQIVEIKNVNLRATKLHFLGGVGGWAWPFGDDKNAGLPVTKIIVHYAGGQNEEILLKNGVEIADYNGRADVPESRRVPDLVERGQVRTFSKPLKQRGVIQQITLESFDNVVAPTFVAITAELGGSESTKAEAPVQVAALGDVAVAQSSSSKNGGSSRPPRVLIVGGGSSHDFEKWFKQADIAILTANGKASVNYTEDPSAILPALKDLDALYLSNNQPIPDVATRKGIFEFAESGKGLLLVHPALWYNWKDWPEYNRVLAGGGARGHDKYGEFEVKLTEVKHPVTDGVPASFKISDECYWFEPDPQGTPIQVLATGYSMQKNKDYPMVFIVQHPRTRIVGIALGHDGKAHEHPAFKKLLQNALAWVSAK